MSTTIYIYIYIYIYILYMFCSSKTLLYKNYIQVDCVILTQYKVGKEKINRLQKMGHYSAVSSEWEAAEQHNFYGVSFYYHSPSSTESRRAVVCKWQKCKHKVLVNCRSWWLSWMRRPTGDQEVAGSTPAEVGNILSWRLIMKYFLWSFSPFRCFKKGSCQFLAKECAQYWLTA